MSESAIIYLISGMIIFDYFNRIIIFPLLLIRYKKRKSIDDWEKM